MRPLIALAAFACTALAHADDVAKPGLATRNVELSYSATIADVPAGATTIDLWLPVAQNTDGQVVPKVTVVKPEGGSIATEPLYGNQVFHKRFTAPFPEDLSAEIVYEIHRTEIVVPQAKDLSPLTAKDLTSRFATYLDSNTLIPVGADPIKAIIARLNVANDPPIRAARKFYDYLIDEFTYNYRAEGAGRGDVLWACDSKTGDCTDYHSMFLALCRNQGIPADHEFGFPIRTKNAVGTIPSFHCWARFYVEAVGWIPIDASEADKHPELRDYNFGSLMADLMKFSHGRDVILVPPQQGPPLNKFVNPYVEVDGQPHAGVTLKVIYKDIPSS